MNLRAIILVFLIHLSTVSTSQWVNVAPGLLGPNTGLQSGGAITYCEGKLWVSVRYKIWMSSDGGTTWSDRTPNVVKITNLGIYSLDFYDGNIGFASYIGGYFLTIDGGQSWREINSNGGPRAQFLDSYNEIAIIVGGHFVGFTNDNGLTWKFTEPNKIDATIMDIQYRGHGALYVLMTRGNLGTFVGYTSNKGDTWIFPPKKVDLDSYTLGLDKCDPNRLYLASEKIYIPEDSISNLSFSSDKGLSWQKTYQKRINSICGSLYVTNNSTLFAQTMDNGVLRSTDRGLTWQNIGGPNGLPDSRLVAAVNNNIVFAVDSSGSVWKTENGGGFPAVETYQDTVFVHPESLFTDTRLTLCDSASEVIKFQSPCPTVFVSKVTFKNPNTTNHKIIFAKKDSCAIRFSPSSIGQSNDTLLLTLNDGRNIEVPLGGTVLDTGYVFTSDQKLLFKQDTLTVCDSMFQTVKFNFSGCRVPSIVSQKVIGIDSLDYSILTNLPQSFYGEREVVIGFKPTKLGFRSAVYEIITSDGKIIMIPLVGNSIDTGYVLSTPSQPLFLNDTVSFCKTIEKSFKVSSAGCTVSDVLTQTIVGKDAGDYTILSGVPLNLTGDDSVTISFTPGGFGLRKASYAITMTDGKKNIIDLDASGKNDEYLVTTSPQLLFERDTLFTCEKKEGSIIISLTGCSVLYVVSQEIVGDGASDYSIIIPTDDSLSATNSVYIDFSPSTQGSRDATYVLKLSDGNTVIVPLLGYGRTPLDVTVSTIDSLFTSVIGGSVQVPIKIDGIESPVTVELDIHYEGINLRYDGTTSVKGNPLDIAGYRTDRSSRILIPSSEMQANGIIAFANFSVYADSAVDSRVSLSGLVIDSQPIPCKYTISGSPETFIKGVSGCGVSIISNFLRYGDKLSLYLYPNPTKRYLTIRSSEVLKDFTIEILDINGDVVKSSSHTLLNSTMDVDLSNLASGAYRIRLYSFDIRNYCEAAFMIMK